MVIGTHTSARTYLAGCLSDSFFRSASTFLSASVRPSRTTGAGRVWSSHQHCSQVPLLAQPGGFHLGSRTEETVRAQPRAWTPACHRELPERFLFSAIPAFALADRFHRDGLYSPCRFIVSNGPLEIIVRAATSALARGDPRTNVSS